MTELPPWLVFLLGSLATYRLALMFSKESGPGRIFKKLRQSASPKSSIREGLECLFCESVWWSAIITWFLVLQDQITPPWALIYCLAMSAVAIAMNQTFTRGDL